MSHWRSLGEAEDAERAQLRKSERARRREEQDREFPRPRSAPARLESGPSARSTRMRVYERDGWRCVRCGCPYRTLRWRDMTQAERDRIRLAARAPAAGGRVTARAADVLIRCARVVGELAPSVCVEVSGHRTKIPRESLLEVNEEARTIRVPRWLASKMGWS